MSLVTVKIHGEEYNIRSADPPEYVEKVAGYVDVKMQEVAHNTKLVASSKIAILAALNIADEFFRYRTNAETEGETVNKTVTELIKLLDKALEEKP